MNSTVSEAEIKALIDLLDDNDQGVQAAVLNRLVEIGTQIVPSLEKAWETTINLSLQTKIETIIQDLQFEEVKNDLQNWVNNGCKDLLFGAFIVSKYQFPSLKYEFILLYIEKIKNDIEAVMNFSLTPLEKIRLINHIFFNIHKYSGNYSNYYAPNNYYINHVIETRKGSPITLAIIYIVVSQKLEIPIYGVNLPKNFIVAYKDLQVNDISNSVIFYANPYNKGAILGKREIDYFLKQQKIDSDEKYFIPCSNVQIIERTLRYLISSYESTNQNDKIERLKKLIKILE